MDYKTLKNWARFILRSYLWHQCAETAQQLLSQNEKEISFSNHFQTWEFLLIFCIIGLNAIFFEIKTGLFLDIFSKL